MKMPEYQQIRVSTHKCLQSPRQNFMKNFGGINQIGKEKLENMKDKHQYFREKNNDRQHIFSRP
jgi:hypothetical protein